MAKRKLIYSIEKGGMLEDWTEELYCTKCKDGSFTMQEIKIFWDDEIRRTRRIKLKNVKGIRTQKRFANELKNLEEFDYTETSDEEFKKIENNLISLDYNFFKGLKNLIEEHFNETNSNLSKRIYQNFDKEIMNFIQVCPKEMLDKLKNPISFKSKIKEVS